MNGTIEEWVQAFVHRHQRSYPPWGSRTPRPSYLTNRKKPVTCHSAITARFPRLLCGLIVMSVYLSTHRASIFLTEQNEAFVYRG